MKKLFVLFILISEMAASQNRNSIWCFGDSAGIDFSNVTNPVNFFTNCRSRGTCASMADSAGNYLFYASYDNDWNNGSGFQANGEVYTDQFQVMDGGDSLKYQLWYNEVIIIPNPANNNTYRLFYAGVSGGSTTFGFYTAKVDLNLNGGLGKVIEKNVKLLDPAMNDQLAAVKHGNGRDWWLVCKPIYQTTVFIPSDTFYVYLITPDSIHAPIKQQIGDDRIGSIGNMTFNNKGDKLATVSANGFAQVFDFDRCTGTLSNVNTLYNTINTRYFFGCAFSPNDSLLYITRSSYAPFYLEQYNIYSHVKTTIAQITSSTPGIGRSPGAVRLAPDGKIYMACIAGDTLGGVAYPYDDTTYYAENMYLGVIENPNVQGTGCNFNPYGFYLGGKRSYWGLPNNPNYELGALVGSGCDTLTGINPTPALPGGEGNLKVWPNPARDEIWYSLGDNGLEIETVEVVNVLGEVVLRLDGVSGKTHINLSEINKGLYLLKVYTVKGLLCKKFVKE